ncbi:thiamine pyrophosphate-binding protein [Candidatus Roizmanbacteria bacterium]|nr:thiamine pyrophosphate-binding protein [Candidatus Roizmanbacteria bacterium]
MQDFRVKNNKIKLSDYIIKFIEDLGVKHIFLISGGGNIHLIDSVGKSKKLKYVCNHHEQACATAAEGYARIKGFGVCLVTTGPGGTNAITGVLGAYQDSIPMLVISGQVRRNTIGAGRITRQFGDQEVNIVDIVKPLTKYAVTVWEPNEIVYHLEKAVYLAKSGRPGPVWIDIPLDVQGWFIESKNLRHFNPKEVKPHHQTDKKLLKKLASKTLQKLRTAKRPVLYAGNGIRLAGATKEFLGLVDLLKIPVLTSYAGYDLIPSSHAYFFGRGHAFGQRAANFILQNSDVLLAIGARLDIRTIGFTYKAFARAAYKIMVDIDMREIKKPTLSIDLAINYDAKQFILEMIKQLEVKPLHKISTQDRTSDSEVKIDDWLEYGKDLNKKYPVVLKDYWKEKKAVNPYCFIEVICKYLEPNEFIIVSDGVGPLNCMYQAFYLKPGQRVILNNGTAQMGYGLPAAIGVAFAANKKKRVICFEGDGSLQLNLHELAVMKYHKLPIKLFIYNNDGYQSIRNTQNNLFAGFHVAVDSKSGFSSVDFVKLAKVYGFKTERIYNHKDMEIKFKKVINTPGPVVCDINTVQDLMLIPKLYAKKLPNGQFVSPPLEDMGPFLPRDEFKKNMLIPLWKE